MGCKLVLLEVFKDLGVYRGLLGVCEGSLGVREGPLGVCRGLLGGGDKGYLSVLGAYWGFAGGTECVQGTTGVCTL